MIGGYVGLAVGEAFPYGEYEQRATMTANASVTRALNAEHVQAVSVNAISPVVTKAAAVGLAVMALSVSISRICKDILRALNVVPAPSTATLNDEPAPPTATIMDERCE